MPDDLIKLAVVAALLADGWVIGRDPYTLDCDEVSLFIDLSCDRTAADGTVERIAVEIKTLPHPYSVYDLHQAVGQVVFYRELLADLDPGRRCYLAVALGAFDGLLCRRDVSRVLTRLDIPVLVIDLDAREVVRWLR